VQRGVERKGRRTSLDGVGHGNRSGVQQQHELEKNQLEKGGEALSVPVDFLIAFTRALIRTNPSTDSFIIAAASARGEVSISDEQMRLFSRAIKGEMKKSPFPKDFF
jgi:hypothetical protein